MNDRELRALVEQLQAELKKVRAQLDEKIELGREPWREEFERLQAEVERQEKAAVKLARTAENDRDKRVEATAELESVQIALKQSQQLVQQILRKFASTEDERQQIIDDLLAERFEHGKKVPNE